MKGYRPAMSFDEAVAAEVRTYQRGDEAAAVAFLAQQARGGPALELAIGTGRIALPLAAQGIRVDGVDIAPAMIAELRTQAGGESMAVTLGDFADVPVEGTYSLIYIVWNTFFNLLTQEEQVRCFANVAAHLGPDGVFVVETYVPAFLYRLQNDRYVRGGGYRSRCRTARRAAPRPGDAGHRGEPRHAECGWDAVQPRRAAVRLAQRAGSDGPHGGAAARERWGSIGTGSRLREQVPCTCQCMAGKRAVCEKRALAEVGGPRPAPRMLTTAVRHKKLQSMPA